jgi:hypothetical protein
MKPLRLDQEHRALDRVMERNRLSDSHLRRLHATTVQDFAQALRSNDYDIVQFSGHGSPDGIYLEKEHGEGATLVSASHVTQLVSAALPSLRLAVLVSCYSSDAAATLLRMAPFLITMDGPAEDAAAIHFVESFYDEFFRSGAIERAHLIALNELRALGKADAFRSVLQRRAKGSGRPLLQATVGQRADSLLIDLGECETDIAALGISRSDFLSLLSRKIRLHEWVFRYPRENAILTIGPYLGVFSWESAEDVVRCHRILRLRATVDAQRAEAWASLLVSYNDLASERYRAVPQPAAPENERLLRQALKRVNDSIKRHFDDASLVALYSTMAPDHFRASATNARAQATAADYKLTDGDLQGAVMHLELSISAIHELVTALTGCVAEKPVAQAT